VHYLKGYTVFNVEQVEGLPAHFYTGASRPREEAPSHCARRGILRRNGRQHSPRRQPGVLLSIDRHHCDAGV
jgi:hypothetical protein